MWLVPHFSELLLMLIVPLLWATVSTSAPFELQLRAGIPEVAPYAGIWAGCVTILLRDPVQAICPLWLGFFHL